MTTTDYVLLPFTILIDSREQAPYHFLGFKADADQKHKPLEIPTATATLPTGDYSLRGFEDRVAIERKSLEDAYSTFSAGRERFERELARMNELEYAAVVIEADWPMLLRHPPRHSRFNPLSLYRSVVAWQIEFPGVHWWACNTRDFAETTTFQLLKRFWVWDDRRKKAEVSDGKSGVSGVGGEDAGGTAGILRGQTWVADEKQDPQRRAGRGGPGGSSSW